MRLEDETGEGDRSQERAAYVEAITNFALLYGFAPDAARTVAELMRPSLRQKPPVPPTQPDLGRIPTNEPSQASILENLSEQLQGINLDPTARSNKTPAD